MDVICSTTWSDYIGNDPLRPLLRRVLKWLVLPTDSPGVPHPPSHWKRPVNHRNRIAVIVIALLVAAAPAARAAGDDAAATQPAPVVRDIVFPAIGEVSWTDTWGVPRSGGRTHQGQDLMGAKMQELVAVADGTITYATTTGPSAGVMVELRATDGWTYSYLHLNNDTPGTDDGAAVLQDMLGPGIERGAEVVAGQLIGFLGDSGNAEQTPPHLHFEMKSPQGVKVNAAPSLSKATHLDASTGGSVPASTSPIPRLAGGDRVATAVAVSKEGWPDGSADAVVAAGDRYAEALPATVLAAARNAPLLLTTGSSLGAVGAELDRLGVQRVSVIGSVPQAAVDAISREGRTVEQIGRPGDPVATAVAVAQAVGGAPDTAVLVNGDRFADGISASALAAGRGWPVLLSTASVVPQPSVDAWRALGVSRIVLVGGRSVIGDNVESFIESRGRCEGGDGCRVERLSGNDRYATSAAVARRSLALGDRSPSTVLVGTGTSYPDALASGPLVSRRKGVALLVDGSGSGADRATRDLLAELGGKVEHVSILGGRGAVSPAADRAVQQALGLGKP